jgi:hypothetical protein
MLVVISLAMLGARSILDDARQRPYRIKVDFARVGNVKLSKLSLSSGREAIDVGHDRVNLPNRHTVGPVPRMRRSTRAPRRRDYVF